MQQVQITKLKKSLGIATAFGTLAAIGAGMHAVQPAAKAQSAGDTIVAVDPSTLPLSVRATEAGEWAVVVSGTTNVALAPGGSVAIAGTPSVAVAGTPTVHLAADTSVSIANNSPANPLWVSAADNPALHQFTYVLDSPFNTTAGDFKTVQAATVPPGQIYVIEHYNVACSVGTGGSLSDVAVLVGNDAVRDDAPPHRAGAGALSAGWVGNGTTRIYATAGQSIQLGAVSNGAPASFCNGEVSGYSVAVPAGN